MSLKNKYERVIIRNNMSLGLSSCAYEYLLNLEQEKQQLEERIKQYENPEDLILMFMYCEENAKDKIKKLQQENKQLEEEIEKERKARLDDYKFTPEELVDLLNHSLVKRVKEQDKQLRQRDEVIDEAIKYIEENTELEHDGDEYGYTEWIDIKEQNIVFINSLLAILQKYKGDNK